VCACRCASQKRALELFGLDPAEWGVNVQPHSGRSAGPHAMALTADRQPAPDVEKTLT
jgi:hypothetical protein